ncbi:hypothetical protein KGY79_10135 [Candidatus Bipolaricaulota bacterium]|nr:hypothetical protein [Candidatus Bipolaricaulota bacterium]
MKKILIKRPAGESEELEIEPGTVASEILSHLNLQGYRLRRPGSDDAEDYFAGDENVYSQVEDGDALKATTEMPVGV